MPHREVASAGLYPVRQVRKPSKQQEESGDECQGTSGNTNNSPETQGSNQGRARSAAKRPRRDVGDEDSVHASIKVSPSKRARKNAHGLTKSASALNINMVAASPLNAGGAPRASAHHHSNSYPGVQSMSGIRATCTWSHQISLRVFRRYAHRFTASRLLPSTQWELHGLPHINIAIAILVLSQYLVFLRRVHGRTKLASAYSVDMVTASLLHRSSHEHNGSWQGFGTPL